MNTRRKASKGDMAGINELKTLIEQIKKDLGEKIDRLASKLEEKDKKSSCLKLKLSA